MRNGQYDDLEGPGYRILMDDDDAVRERPRAGNEAEEGKSKGKGEDAGKDAGAD